mgnify:CR=1 FL=1
MLVCRVANVNSSGPDASERLGAQSLLSGMAAVRLLLRGCFDQRGFTVILSFNDDANMSDLCQLHGFRSHGF